MGKRNFSITAGVLAVAVLYFQPAAAVNAAGAEKMTYEQAVQRIPARQLPDFWIGDVKDLPDRWQKLKLGKVSTIATSPGGRPIHLITYGQLEKVKHAANFNSAVGGWDQSAYMDKSAQKAGSLFRRSRTRPGGREPYRPGKPYQRYGNRQRPPRYRPVLRFAGWDCSVAS